MLAKHSGLSFERLEFDSEEFSVDEWIQRKRQTVPLDVLRDDLGSHLKFLRSSLIELINQDYGQFVNLSSNLVGLDGKVQNIQGPLNKVKVDLQVVDQFEYFNRTKQVREFMICLNYFRVSWTP